MRQTRFSWAIASAAFFLFAGDWVAADIDSHQFMEVYADGRPAIDSPGETWGASWGDFNQDGWPDLWLARHQYTPMALYRNNGDGSFTDVAEIRIPQLAEHQIDDTHGSAWADFNNDGWPDILEVCGGAAGQAGVSPVISDEWRNNLFVNTGDTLVESAETHGLDYPRGRSRTPLWVDYDKDGWLDAVVGAEADAPDHYPPSIFRGNDFRPDASGNRFWFVEQKSETGFDAGSCQYVLHAHLGPSEHPTLLCADTAQVVRAYDITSTPFTDVTALLGDALFNSYFFDVALADFDGDLDVDVFGGVAPSNLSTAVRVEPSNDRIHAFLTAGSTEKGFRFSAPGPVEIEFGWATDRSAVRLGSGGVAPPGDSDRGLRGRNRYPHRVAFTLSPSIDAYQGIADDRSPGPVYIGYVDGAWEIVAAPSKALPILVKAEGISMPTPIGSVETSEGTRFAPKVLLQDADGRLITQETSQSFPENTLPQVLTYARSVAVADFDNDRDLDVYVGASGRAANAPNLLFDNLGNGTFVLTESAGGAAGSSLGRTDTVTTVDYDQDGFVDLFVTQGMFPAPFSYAAEQQLFRNVGRERGNANHWILLDLEGTASNRSAIGARVYARTEDGVTQLREQNNGIHRHAQDYTQIHFGLAQYAQADIRVVWPNGTDEWFCALPANDVSRLIEGRGSTDCGGAPPVPRTEPACGEPAYDAETEAAVFIWQGCNSSEWYLRATAGGQDEAVSFVGSLTSGQGFLRAPTAFDLEDEDVLPPDFRMRVMAPWIDGFDFSLSPRAEGDVCFSLGGPSALPIYLGSNRVDTATLASPRAFNLDDFGACTSDVTPTCGEPVYDPDNETGLFIWQECGSNYWHVRATAGGRSDPVTYSGRLTSAAGFAGEPAALNFEEDDMLPPDFRMQVTDPWQDGFGFAVASGTERDVCLTLDETAPEAIYVGSNRMQPERREFNLADFGACEP